MLNLRSPRRAGRALPLLAAVLLGACAHDVPLAPAAPAPASPLAELTCTVQVSARLMSCAPASGGGARRDVVTVGGQNQYVRMASSGTAYDSTTGLLSSNVTVQNLLAVAIGTADGTTPDPDGVQVFFPLDPTNGVRVENPTGLGTFTGVAQPYFQYSGATDLGADGVLSPGETSAAKTWQFRTNGAGSFTFSVYMQAQAANGTAPATVRLRSLAAGQVFSCGVTAEGSAYCWGRNLYGEVGDGTTTIRTTPVRVAQPAGVTFASVAAAFQHACGLTAAGQAYCWGHNTSGELGDSSRTNRLTPVPVRQPVGVSFTSVVPSGWGTCALTAPGQAYCWGNDNAGTLGDGGTALQVKPVAVAQGALKFTSLVAGEYHVCGLTEGGQAYCWGDDYYGQLGDGSAMTHSTTPTPVLQPTGVTFTALGAGLSHTCGVASDGRAYCWGYNVIGQLGDSTETDHATPQPVSQPAGVVFTSIGGGVFHTCAGTAAGQAYCWGNNAEGELGNGSFVESAKPVAVLAPAGVTFASLVVGGYDVCGLPSAGPAYCWGSNAYGTVGDGTTTARSTPVAVASTR